jgi:hypothetical protein
MSYEYDSRMTYKRLANALETEEERLAFSAQVDSAKIEPVDAEHDRFDLPAHFSGFGPWIPGRNVDATYRDVDGARVNVIVHIIGGKLSWAERYRDVGGTITMWPPSRDVVLRFLRYDINGTQEIIGTE